LRVPTDGGVAASDVPSGGTDGAGTRGAERVADVLTLFLSNSATLGVSDIARTLGLSKAVVHRILQSLSSRGLVELSAQDQRYRAGPTITDAGLGSFYEYDHAWHAEASSVLSDLRSRTGETATLSARVGDMRLFVDQMEGAAAVRLSVALWRLRPLYIGASGKAILAFMDPAQQRRVIHNRVVAGAREAVPDAELQAELDRIRAAGIALSRAEVNPDALACAAPILRAGRPVGAVGILSSVRRESDVARFAPMVRDAGEQLSRAFADAHGPRSDHASTGEAP
jgi:DNA-binding IclR family transcriptional regulator